MIPFYGKPEIDCFNCIYWKRKNESGEMFCKEEHRCPKPYEHCEFQKNEYQRKLEIIDDWLDNDALTKEGKERALVWRAEFDRKNRRQAEIDQKRREEEKEIDKKGLGEVISNALMDNC